MSPETLTGDVRRKPGPSVLVVDDNPGTLESMTALLRVLGMHAYGAATGEDALAIARRQWFDLALIDQNLPGISGLQVASALRTEGIVVPWVMYSGFLDHEIAREAGRLGALRALSLPFDVDIVVSDALSQATSEREGVWRRLRNGVRIEKPVRAVGHAAWWIVVACSSRDDLREIQTWGRFVGESGSTLRREFSRLNVRPLAAQRFMRILRALAHVDGRTDAVEGELASADPKTMDSLFAQAGLRVSPGSPPITFEYYLAHQQFIPRDHPLLTALRDLLATR